MPRKPDGTAGKSPARKPPVSSKLAESYSHPDQRVLMRPEVGTQASFRKKKAPVTYRYDSSLSPSLEWDGKNGSRELGEWLLGVIGEAARLAPLHVLPSPAELKGADGQVIASVRSLDVVVISRSAFRGSRATARRSGIA